jgi:hypothetical protein
MQSEPRPITVTLGVPGCEIKVGTERMLLTIEEAKDLFAQLATFASLRDAWAQQTLRDIFVTAVGRVDAALAPLRKAAGATP